MFMVVEAYIEAERMNVQEIVVFLYIQLSPYLKHIFSYTDLGDASDFILLLF